MDTQNNTTLQDFADSSLPNNSITIINETVNDTLRGFIL